MSSTGGFWPNGARLAVTVSMQFEAGGQPISGAPGPVTEAVQPGYDDLPQNLGAVNPDTDSFEHRMRIVDRSGRSYTEALEGTTNIRIYGQRPATPSSNANPGGGIRRSDDQHRPRPR